MAARARPLIALLAALTLLIAAALIIQRVTAPPVPPRELFPYGEIHVGVDASRPPFAVATDDNLWGLEIDLARELGRRIDLPIRFVNLGFDGLYDALKSDRIDVLIAGVTIDLTRLEEVHFTQPYFNAGLVLVSDRDIQTMADLPNRSLAYEFGSEADAEARRWLRRVLPFESRPYELPEYALDAVRLGAADAALVDSVSARLYLRDHASWNADMHQVTDALYAIATQSRRPALSAAVNDALQAMLADGTLDAIINRWL